MLNAAWRGLEILAGGHQLREVPVENAAAALDRVVAGEDVFWHGVWDKCIEKSS